MAERWTIVASSDLRSLVEIKHSDNSVFIREDLTKEESKQALEQMARTILTLQQTLAVR
jgi:hypothetical protein